MAYHDKYGVKFSDDQTELIKCPKNLQGTYVIPDSVTVIGVCAFSSCTGLTSIKIPNSVTEIGSRAFRDCTGLTSVTIPNSVTKIGDYAFSGCISLTSIKIPDSITKIEYNAFGMVPNIVYAGRASNSPWGARSLNGIVNGWFVYSDNTKTNLLACSSAAIGEIKIPNSVTKIGNRTFSGCTGLTSIEIPDSVTKIGNRAFEGCTCLTIINVDAANRDYSDIDGVLFDKNKETLLKYPTGRKGIYSIPNSVIKIGRDTTLSSTGIGEAFGGCIGLTSIEIPDSVTEIDSRAFSGCTGLASVTIGSSVTCINSGAAYLEAFYGCTNLKNFCVAVDNPVFCDINGVLFTKDHTTLVKYPCYRKGDYEIPHSVTKIGKSAFEGCTDLTSVTIPHSVTEIGGWTFSGCTALTSVKIPNSVTTIGMCVFEGCTGLTSIEIPDSVTSIVYKALKGCTGLTSIEIPNSVTEIEDWAFSGCTGLTSIKIPNSVTKIGNGAFSGCTGLTSIEIPDSVTKIGNRAFEGCTNLTSIVIPNSVTEIGEFAFDKCYKLQLVVWNAINCTSYASIINNRKLDVYPPFRNCPNISSFIIGAKVQKLPSGLCYGLPITSIKIPDSVIEIGKGGFSGCTGLTSPIFNAHVFAYLPTSYSGAYIIPDGIKQIADYAFSGCTGLTNVTIPSSVVSIGKDAFKECTALETIIIPYGQKERFIQMDGLKGLEHKIVEKDYEKITVLYNLAKANEFGIGLPQNIPNALVAYMEAAEKGSPDAAYRLGEWYRDGNHVTRDLRKAAAYFQEAAKGGFKNAAEMYEQVLEIEEKEKKDEEQRRAADERQFQELREQQSATIRQEEKLQIDRILKENHVEFLYHFTARENIPSIKQNGGLYAWGYMRQHNLVIPVQGGGELSQNMDEYAGFADYVHLSFCKNHPMAYRLEQEGHEIVVLRISPEVALLDDTMFSDMNALDTQCTYAKGVEGLKKVNFLATGKTFLRRTDPLFKYKQAEVMVKTHIPSKYILNLDDF